MGFFSFSILNYINIVIIINVIVRLNYIFLIIIKKTLIKGKMTKITLTKWLSLFLEFTLKTAIFKATYPNA